jgi:hypothetical protein
MTEPPQRRSPVPQSAERTPLPVHGTPPRGDARLVEAWREWLRALATDAEAALAAAIAYRELDGPAREEWLDALEQDAPGLSVPKFAVYAPLLAVESDAERRDRIHKAVGSLDTAVARVDPHGLQGVSRQGFRVAVLVSPLYLDFVQVLACAYRPEQGFEWVRHDPIVDRRRVPQHGDRLEGVTIEKTPLAPLIDELAHAVLAHKRSGRELPEALRVFADLFGPAVGGSTPPPPSES